jgi:hypothetical protein
MATTAEPLLDEARRRRSAARVPLPLGRYPHGDRAAARLPAEAETVALYVADRRPATIAAQGRGESRSTTARTDHPTPTDHDVVRAVVRGTRRQLGVAQPQKTALELDARRTVVLAIPNDLRGLRDRALLLLGWAAALRRNELVALEVADLGLEPEGVVLTIRRSKI